MKISVKKDWDVIKGNLLKKKFEVNFDKKTSSPLDRAVVTTADSSQEQEGNISSIIISL